MKIIVFVGPTLHGEDPRVHVAADYRPPAAQGDVYCAALERPWGIAIIDGYFERAPAVWHKEILWAMSRGIHVFGAASMGALRAAELHTFGMRGEGAIFEAFRDGELLDDDEVAIAHADAESGYRPASVALVDVRATLALAVERGVIAEETRVKLLSLAKRRYYVERSYSQLFADAHVAGLATQSLEAFCREHPVSAKRADALALLRRLAELRAIRPQPKPLTVSFRFEHTAAFQQLTRRFTASAKSVGEADLQANVLEELRLQPEKYKRAVAAALTRRLVLELAERQGLALDEAAVRGAISECRRERGLWSGEATLAFMKAQQLDRESFEELAKRETLIRLISEQIQSGLGPQIIEYLQSSGEYAELARCATRKRELPLPCGETTSPEHDVSACSSTRARGHAACE